MTSCFDVVLMLRVDVAFWLCILTLRFDGVFLWCVFMLCFVVAFWLCILALRFVIVL